ncbi:MAG: GNAT family N-acetyltransferase [Pseudomonadota bacterium]
MTDEPIDQKLRDMAEHRGLKLLKSRKRKPGSGDYGKFGLTDAEGEALLGVSEKGLTASPEDIEAYLRKGATSTWKASAEATPALSPNPYKARAQDEEPDEEPVIRRRRGATDRVQAPGPAETVGSRPDSRASDKSAKPGTRRRSKITAEAAGKHDRQANAPAKPAPTALEIRIAKSSDSAGLSGLLRQLAAGKADELGVARNLEKLRKAGGGACIAEKGEIIGCCCWTSIQTLQHGLIGRITLLLVDKGQRRQGVGSALLNEACAALRKAGCSRIEAMSDIAISNAHNFFRALKFEQTSYRFARDMASDD